MKQIDVDTIIMINCCEILKLAISPSQKLRIEQTL